MGNYLLFAGDKYYPLGGWGDFVGAFDSIENALTWVAGLSCDWWHIVNLVSGSIVRAGIRE